MSRNIKEIGKELMGKSLNSFHRKTGLTQLEKNNEMQDGILDGILSQVDDAYIEKTEQSNVIHLDGSGDGVVVLDSIEGNTMINCVKDFIPSTIVANNYNLYQHSVGTTYTIILDVVKEGTCLSYAGFLGADSNWSSSTFDFKNSGRYIKKIKSTKETKYFRINGISEEVTVNNIIILEGDWTNKEISPYFEGLQSSFEEKVNDEGKYKIEILMKNKNLLDLKNPVNVGYTPAKMEGDKIVLNSSGVEGERISMAFPVYMKKGSTYRFSYSNIEGNSEVLGSTVQMHPNLHTNGQFGISTKNPFTWDRESGIYYARIYNVYVAGTVKVNVQLEENSVATTYVEPKQNKIKLLINKPLRGLPNGTKDELCIKDDKLVIKRRCGETTLKDMNIGYTNGTYLDIFNFGTIGDKYNVKTQSYMTCDKFPYVGDVWNGCQAIGIGGHNNINFRITYPKETMTVDSLTQWLQNNQTTVVYELAEPTYEEVLNEYGEPIILEGYENGTLYIDSTIVPTTTVRYTPKMESFKTLNEVSDNNTMLTNDINDNIIPYLMDVDLMIMEKEMALPSQINIRKMEVLDMTSMQKRTQDMLERLIKGKTLTEQECKTRVAVYLNAGKITDAQAEELNFLIDEIYA